jgi:hypothetical protein
MISFYSAYCYSFFAFSAEMASAPVSAISPRSPTFTSSGFF